jgi:hypothetical protein
MFEEEFAMLVRNSCLWQCGSAAAGDAGHKKRPRKYPWPGSVLAADVAVAMALDDNAADGNSDK